MICVLNHLQWWECDAESGAGRGGQPASTPTRNPFGYTGVYTNPTTGLIHYGARYYDPTLGRFTQPDPQTHPGDITQSSPYPYAGNDPINVEDPTGRCGVFSSFNGGGSCKGDLASDGVAAVTAGAGSAFGAAGKEAGETASDLAGNFNDGFDDGGGYEDV